MDMNKIKSEIEAMDFHEFNEFRDAIEDTIYKEENRRSTIYND